MDTIPSRPDPADAHRRAAAANDWSTGDPFAHDPFLDDPLLDDPLLDEQSGERGDVGPFERRRAAERRADVLGDAHRPDPAQVGHAGPRSHWSLAGTLTRVMRPWLDPRPGELRGAIALLALSLALTLALWFDASRRPQLPPGRVAASGVTLDPERAGDVSAPLGREGVVVGADPVDWGVGGAGSVTARETLVVVHVTGAVRIAGLVSLPVGSRVGDGIDAAGGVLPDARIDRLNLARVLVDGEHVHVPRVGEDAPLTVDAPSQGVLPDGRIDLNRASAAELETLPGVGPARAQAILTERQNRPFAVPGDLRRVPGIGEATFQRLAPLVAVR
jgi:competence protein ComEA